jgi:membrane fusion protein, heavy metal efflux system
MNSTREMCVLLPLALLLAGCGRREEGAGAAVEKKTEPHAITLTRQSVREIGLEWAAAEIQPLRKEIVIAAKLAVHQDHEAQVGTMVQGRVSKVLVNLGDRVQPGQELMHIEGVEIGDIKSGFIKAKAQLVYAEAALKRQQALIEQNVGAQKSLLESQAEFEKARAGFMAEDRKIHSIGLNDSDVETFIDNSSTVDIGAHVGGILPIKAPIAGVVFERNVVIGQLMDPSTTAFRIINTSVLWVDGQVHEGDVSALRGRPEITVVVPAASRAVIRARILYVGETIDPGTRMVKVRAALQNPGGMLKPGMFAEMHIPFGDGKHGTVIHEESLIKDGNDRFVFVAVNDTTFVRRDVIPGLALGDFVEVASGVAAGEKIVTKGSFMLKSELKKESFGEGE